MPRQRITTASLNVRVTHDQERMLTERADRLGISISEATRQLLDLGGVLERYEAAGLVISDDVQAMVARREPLIVGFARDAEDPEHGPLWIVTPEELRAHEERGEG